MGKFKMLVDQTIALVKEKGQVPIAVLAYQLNVSPDYARKIAKSAVAVSPDPMKIDSHFNSDTCSRDPPTIYLTSYLERTEMNHKRTAEA